MAKGHLIAVATWDDPAIASLSLRQRLLWIGLVTTADDQGRGLAHPGLLRAHIFPFDDFSNEAIEQDLAAIAALGLVTLYDDAYQVTHWWQQQHPYWAWPSDLPAPPDWVDRERYRRGNQVVQRNWERQGGFEPEGATSRVPAAPPPSDTRPKTLDVEGDEAAPAPDAQDEVPAPVANERGPTAEPRRDHSGPTVGPAPNGNDNGNNNNNDNGEREGEGEGRPQTGPPPPARARPPAVMVFYRTVGWLPNRVLWNGIDTAVGAEQADLEFWERVIKNWIATGYSERNIQGMLDFYMRRELPSTRGYGYAKPPPDVEPGPAPTYTGAEAERVRRLLNRRSQTDQDGTDS